MMHKRLNIFCLQMLNSAINKFVETLSEIICDMEENLIMDKTDRISQLPECIVHHILSFLDPLERVQMSLLSKEWFSLTASFPILEFDINDNLRYKSDNNVRDMFYKYVEYSTSRFLEQNVSAHIYNITTDLMKPEDVDILDKCLGLILKKGVQVLKIYIPDRLQSLPMYRLPNIPVLSSSMLTSLNINSCELPSSLLVDDLEFKSLKKLFLYFVQIDEKILKHLISSCPLLEIFNVGDCYGFKTFCVCGHQKLQKVRIRYKHEVERIDIIEVPNLCYLLLNDLDGRGETSMNLSSCKKLTTVSYNGYPFTNFLSNFPFIENFYLKPPGKRENLKLSSPTLKTFVLYSQYNMDKINIDAPNLISFKYNGSLQMLTSLVSGPSNLKTRMECYCNKNDLNLWLKALWRFLLNNTGFILWELHISTKLIDIAPKVSLPLHYELEHVTLDLKNKLSIYVDAVDGVLWFFRPRCLTLKSNLSFWSKNDVKRVHKSLLQQENEDRTNIQIVLPSSSRCKTHFSNMNAYLKASPNDLINEITFIKEEVAEEPIHTVVQETDAWDLWLSFFFE